MGERIRAFDWASHPLGPPEGWPAALRMAVSLCLNSSFPTAVYWGPELYVLYNDAWSVIPAEKHPWILGKPAREGWADIWPIVGPQFRQVMEGEGLALFEQMLPMVRGGKRCETWWNYSFTPIRDADNVVHGVFNQGNEITGLVRARRRREAEIARWREMFQQAPAGVALLRGPRYVFEFANDAYLRLVADRDIVGKPLEEALPEVGTQGFVELLEGVSRTGEPYVGAGVAVRLQRRADQPLEDCVVDFVYQPLRNAEGQVDGIFVLVTDVTERARAEKALRLSNWQLGEERARLASLIEAEQRAQKALRQLNERLEAHVQQRTAELTHALAKQTETMHRLRAALNTDLLFQGFLDKDGTILDANPAALAAIGKSLEAVKGQRFWDSPWFAATPGMPQLLREAVEAAAQGRTVHTPLTLELPGGTRSFQFTLRPIFDARGQVVGLVPEAVDAVQAIPVAPAGTAEPAATSECPSTSAGAPSRTAAAP